tara:strand:+ start:462 stop:710 length:249 start_codon:yes stop_codon:yes gene_type:complete
MGPHYDASKRGAKNFLATPTLMLTAGAAEKRKRGLVKHRTGHQRHLEKNWKGERKRDRERDRERERERRERDYRIPNRNNLK